MKRLLIAIIFLLILTGCNGDSDDMETPDGSTIATCPAGQEFKYIYNDDTVYEFYTDNVEQTQAMIDIVQDAADAAGSMSDYLTTTFGSSCVFTTYNTED